MRSFLCLLLLMMFARADDAPVWADYHVGVLKFQMPGSWGKGVQEPPNEERETLFFSKVPELGTMRIRRLPAPAEPIQALPASEKALETLEWKEAVSGLIAGGCNIHEVKVRSKVVGGVGEDEVMGTAICDGRHCVVWSTTWRRSGQAVRAELVYYRRAPKPTYEEAKAMWESLSFDRSAAPEVAGKTGGPVTSTATVPTATILVKNVSDTGAPGSNAPAVPAARTVPRTVAEIVQDFRDSLVFIEGGGGSGSGFIYKTKEGVFLMTNQHVMAGMPQVKCTRLDGAPVKLGAGGAAVGHDEIRFATDPPPMPFEMGEQIDSLVKIGDEVVVLGNSEGSRVIAPLRGKLVGIGPDRIEVDAQFVPGNSGSPIIHVPTGKVIGIATYLERRRYTELTNDKEGKIRRFGYRLDSVKQWQPVNWAAFQAEHGEIEKITALTRDFARLLDDLAKDGRLNPAQHTNPALVRIMGDLDKALGRQAMSAPDRARALQNFVASLRSATQADMTAARGRLRFDFFLRQLAEEAAARDEFYKIFDKLAKAASH